MKPDEIEALSFKIIEEETGSHAFSQDQWAIVRRMIHTSADFEYLESVRFHPEAIQAGLKAIQNGKAIYTDTQMARSGINQERLKTFGVTVHCLIGDPRVVDRAKQNGITRAQAAVDLAGSELDGCIYGVGNAPTALLQLIKMIKEKRLRPALVVGLPVGFVNAAESKAALLETDIPYITNVGRKGGSNLAASVINALAIMAQRN